MKQKRPNNQSKIIQSAKRLFNEADTLSISTNHIAKDAGISTGNLYYYYKNKEEIILDLYKELSEKFVALNGFDRIEQSINPIRELHHMFDLYETLFLEYRFLLRDSAVLTAMYPSVKELFLKNQKIRVAQIEQVLLQFMSQGIFIELPLESIHKRAKLHWFITGFWQVYISTTGEVTQASIQEAKEVFFEFMIYPNLSEKGNALLEQI